MILNSYINSIIKYRSNNMILMIKKMRNMIKMITDK